MLTTIHAGGDVGVAFTEDTKINKVADFKKILDVITNWMVLPLYMLFWILDIIYVPQYKWEFLGLRCLLIPSALIINHVTKKIQTLSSLQNVALFYIFILALILQVMLYVVGPNALYYNCLHLVALGSLSFLPFSNRYYVFTILAIYGPYYAIELKRITLYNDYVELIVNTFIVASVLLITLVIKRYHLILREKEHELLLSVEVAKDQLELKNAQLQRQATTDHLTNLNNRVVLDQTLNNEIQRFNRYKSILSIIIIDIDYFKDINDRFGHQEGDKVLQEVAFTLRNNIRSTDVVGRWGGEEFLIVCTHTDRKGARSVSEKLRSKIESLKNAHNTNITSSFGIAELAKGEAMTDLICNADAALYKAKENGRNRVEG